MPEVNLVISDTLLLSFGSNSWKNFDCSNSDSFFWNIFLNSLLTDYKLALGKKIITLSSLMFYASISDIVFCKSTFDILFLHSNSYIYILCHNPGYSLTSISNKANETAKYIVLFCSHTALNSCLKWSFFNLSIFTFLDGFKCVLPIELRSWLWEFGLLRRI